MKSNEWREVHLPLSPLHPIHLHGQRVLGPLGTQCLRFDVWRDGYTPSSHWMEIPSAVVRGSYWPHLEGALGYEITGPILRAYCSEVSDNSEEIEEALARVALGISKDLLAEMWGIS